MIEKVFILHHTHVDFGYTDTRRKVLDDLVAMVDEATDLVKASADRPEPERFRWIHEGFWPVMEYLRRGGARREEMFEQIRGGRVELTALYMNPTDLFDRDSFERSTDYACDLARRENLPLVSAMFSDCPGIPWSLPDILASRGIKYLSAAPDFIMSFPLEVERPFYWEGPDGGRVLTWFTEWRHSWYAEGIVHKLAEDFAKGTENLLAYIRRISDEGYRWRGLAIHFGMDNVPAEPKLMDFVAHFNAAQSGIEARMATNREFFEFMEQQHGSQFAVHRAAWPDWWANGNGSAAFESACSRRTKNALRRMRELAAMGKAAPDPARLEEVYEQMLLFDEHTWGASISIRAPWSLQGRLQWQEKRIPALKALDQVRRIEREVTASLAEDGRVTVTNPFDHEWTGAIALPVSDKKKSAGGLKDVESGELAIGQREKAGAVRDHYALRIGPRATRRFELAAKAPKSSVPAAMENDYYRLDYDPQRGTIGQIVEKSSGRELCDAGAEWSFAEIIHERARQGSREEIYDISYGSTSPEAKRPRPELVRQGGHVKGRKPRLITGPVFNALVTTGNLPKVRFAREVRLYHALPRIDVILRLDKQVETAYESLYLAFPLAGQSPEVWIENAGAAFRAGIDQLPGSATDWLSVGDYVAVSQADHTTVLAPHDVPLVQVGDIHTGKWLKRLEVANGHVYSWVMNNLWFTNFPAYQEGQVQLVWSLTSGAGLVDHEAARRFVDNSRVGPVVAGVSEEQDSVVW